MKVKRSADEYLALLGIASSADFQEVFDALQKATIAPLAWDGLGDDAEFLVELRVGSISDPGKTVVTFSKWGNLCYAYFPESPLIAPSILDDILISFGWERIEPEEARVILYPASGETVHHRFFNYT